MWTTSQLEFFLSGISISPEIFALRPDYRALLILLSNIPGNGPSDAESSALLSAAEESVRATLQDRPSVTEIPHIAAWRDAYRAFGAKPAKHRSSLEALTRRVTATGGLPRVNRLTDVYNAVSVRRQIPLGVEDLDRYVGAAGLRRASGEERFETRDGVECPEKGEVVWCDEAGVTCRRWNWRQGVRTALTERTESVIVIADALEPCSDEELDAIGEELVQALSQGGEDVRVARRIIRAS